MDGVTEKEVQAEKLMIEAADHAFREKRDPIRMLRVLSLHASAVRNASDPEQNIVRLDLSQEWHVLAEKVRRSGASILLTRLIPPTLSALRSALSPRTSEQKIFPNVLHFSGHAWKEGLFFENDLGQMHPARTDEILEALHGLPGPLDLVVLNGCESAADARSVAQALFDGGLARAVVGHEKPVYDDEAVAFAARLYSELTGGFALDEAVKRAGKEVSTHKINLLGDGKLHFENLSGGGPLIDECRPKGNLPAQRSHFLGRGKELVDISKDLAHPPKMLVLSGPQGIGKSSLVLEAAWRNGWRFPGGVAYASATRLGDARSTSANEMLNALASALGLDGAEDLSLYSAMQPTLFLLDGLESLEGKEQSHIRDFLASLGNESAAILALRPSCDVLEDLPAAKSLLLHQGLSLEEAISYAHLQAVQRKIPLTPENEWIIASAVDGHPLLIEQLVAQARRQDLDELLEDVAKKRGDFAARIEKVYSWSAARLDPDGLDAWKALLLFPGGNAPQRVLRAAAGGDGPQKLRDAALADFDPSQQLWRWHATVVEYARSHFSLTDEEKRSRMLALLPVWSEWLERLPAGERMMLSRLEASRSNLEKMVEECKETSRQDAWPFLDRLDKRLPRPDRTIFLRKLVEMVWETKLILLPTEEAVERAKLLNNMGNALTSLGRLKEALYASENAVDIYRGLAKANPQIFLPDLATALSNLGIRLFNQGLRENALELAQEAVDIQRKLDEANRVIFKPGLASSLNNLSPILSSLGQKEKALILAQEAVAINKQLAESNPQRFLPDLAASLYNLGYRFSELNQRNEALDAVQQVVNIYQQFVRSNPQAFLPVLAASLNNLGGRLSDLGRWDDALLAVHESVNIFRKLSVSNPHSFLPELAMSLNNLGKTFSFMNQPNKALSAVQESADIYRMLAKTNPQAFLPKLAKNLNNLSLGRYNLGLRREALEAIEEAVVIRRRLIVSDPQTYRSDLATSLQNQGIILSGMGQNLEALDAANEAVEIFSQLAEVNPKTFLPDLARSLGTYGGVLNIQERHQEASRAFAEGLRILAPFHKELPQAFSAQANALRRYYIKACKKSGQEPDAKLL